MAGNKTIKGIAFAGIITLALTACKVQLPNYVGLYVDNSFVNDTIYPGESPLNILDTALTYVFNPTSFMEAKLPVYLLPVEEIFKLSSDSVYQLEVEKLLSAITDSVQLLDYQMNELQKQLTVMPGSGFTGEKQLQFLPRDSLQTEVDFRQMIQEKNEKIFELQKQLNELQNFGIIKSDTSYVIRETVKSPIAESQQSDYLSQQMLKDTNDKIQKLQKQLHSVQTSAAKTPQRAPVTVVAPIPLGSQQNNQLTQQTVQAQSDTIQLLKSQIQNLQPEPQKTDTVYKENEAEEMQPAKEFDNEQNATDLQALQNALQLLKTRVLILEAQTVPEKTAPAPAMQEERDTPVREKSDTTLIVALYKLGEIKPIEVESVLKQIKELCNDNNVMKITLSGFTDNSGNATINKKITTRRLNYLSEKMTSWISKEKIFFQNFGDTFASDTMVNDERRIEIRIHTK